jgi:zinc protease
MISLNRTKAPAFTRSIDFSLRNPSTQTLLNGIAIHYLVGGKQPVLKIEILLKAGRWFEQQGGAAYFMSQLFTRGTRTKNSFQIAETFDSLGAHVDVSAGLDIVSISMYTLTKHALQAIALLVEILQEAAFPEHELEQIKSIYLQNLNVNQEKTSFQASKLFRKHLFGSTHPYGKELDTKEVNELTRSHIVDHNHLFGQDITVIVSGDVPTATQTFINAAFEALSVKRVEDIHRAPVVTNPGRDVVNKEGSVQASLRIGKSFIGRKHPDYAASVFLTHAFGGYFGSRLMKNIREEKGLTYGIHASLNTLLHDSYLLIGADVNKENVSLAFDEIQKEMKRLSTELMPADELDTARNHFIGSLQGEVTNAFAHADKFRTRLLFDLPEDFYQTLIHKIDALTANDLIDVAEKHFQTDSFIEVAFG